MVWWAREVAAFLSGAGSNDSGETAACSLTGNGTDQYRWFLGTILRAGID